MTSATPANPASAATDANATVKMQAVTAGPNRLVISREALSRFPETQHFDVDIADGRIVLTPAQTIPIMEVWEHIASLGLTEADIADAIAWARKDD